MPEQTISAPGRGSFRIAQPEAGSNAFSNAASVAITRNGSWQTVQRALCVASLIFKLSAIRAERATRQRRESPRMHIQFCPADGLVMLPRPRRRGTPSELQEDFVQEMDPRKSHPSRSFGLAA